MSPVDLETIIAMENALEKRDAGAHWLWRFVRHLLKFCAAVGFVAVHHLWFGIDTRGAIQSGIDGIFLMAFTYGLVWLMRSGPNVPDQPRGPSEDGVSDAGESPEDGRLPALRCGDWFGSSFLSSVINSSHIASVASATSRHVLL